MIKCNFTQKQIEKWQLGEVAKLKKAIKQELKGFEDFCQEISSSGGSSASLFELQSLESSFEGVLADMKRRKKALEKTLNPPAYDPKNPAEFLRQLPKITN
jgi:hypothetical protein